MCAGVIWDTGDTGAAGAAGAARATGATGANWGPATGEATGTTALHSDLRWWQNLSGQSPKLKFSKTFVHN